MARNNYVETLVYENWSGSSFEHNQNPTRNGDGYFSINMQRSNQGMLKVRPAMNTAVKTGLTLTHTIDNRAYIAVRPKGLSGAGSCWVAGLNSGEHWYFDSGVPSWSRTPDTAIETTVNSFSTHSYGTSYGGGGTHYPLPVDDWLVGGEGGINDSNTAFAITWTDATDDLVGFTFYRDRIFGWVDPSASTDPPNRLFYTDAGDYRTSSAGNYIDIGAASSDYYIIGAWPVRDSLLIAMSNGTWFAFVGDSPDTGSLRSVGDYPVPAHGGHGCIFNDAVWFYRDNEGGVCIATPQGVDSTTFADVKIRTSSGCVGAVAHSGNQSVHMIFAPSGFSYIQELEFVNGAWHYHVYGGGDDYDVSTATTFGITRAVTASGSAFRVNTINDTKDRLWVLLEDNVNTPGSTEVQLLYRRMSSTSAVGSGGEQAPKTSSGTDSYGLVRFDAFSPPPGHLCRVKSVTVDFLHQYNTTTPTMRCRVFPGGNNTALDTENDFATVTLPNLSSSGDQDSGRHTFRFDPGNQPWQHSVHVQLDTIEYMTISRVLVEYEVTPLNHLYGEEGGA